VIYIGIMRHDHRGGPDRPNHPDNHHGPHGRHRGARHGRHRGRLFDYGELRLLLLAMIAERPRHGYELIKEIGDRFGGAYVPSPGVVYPTLAWLDDMGYAAIDPEPSGRKLYRITPEGEAFLSANRAAADDLLARISAERPAGYMLPESVLHAMKRLKHAMRMRLHSGPIDEVAAERITAALDAATRSLENSR